MTREMVSKQIAAWLFCVIATSIYAVGACWRVSAHESDGHAEREFTEAEQHRPTPLPDRVILTWSGDPTKSIDVTWRTDDTVGSPQVEYAVANSLRGNLRTGDIEACCRVAGSTQRFDSDLGAFLIHSARLEVLKPDTMYAYRVGGGAHWSEWFQFRTASAEAAPFTFVYFGDAQNAVRSMWSRVIREANQYAPRAAFMLHAGDLVNRAHRDAEWGEWFGAGSWLNGMIPSIATPGNHEYDEGVSRHWRPQFAFPMNGPDGLEETVFWLDYQGARLISLNSNERDRLDEQSEWLKGVLEDADRPKWTIVTFHHPIFSAAKERDNPELRAAWRPIFEQYGVDLVLQGHDHAYNRSGLGGPSNVNVPEGVRRQTSNTVYVVSVSGPKMYTLQQEWDVSRVASGVQLFQVISVSPKRIRFEARLATGELYDAFTLFKGADGISVLEDAIPDIQEIRR